MRRSSRRPRRRRRHGGRLGEPLLQRADLRRAVRELLLPGPELLLGGGERLALARRRGVEARLELRGPRLRGREAIARLPQHGLVFRELRGGGLRPCRLFGPARLVVGVARPQLRAERFDLLTRGLGSVVPAAELLARLRQLALEVGGGLFALRQATLGILQPLPRLLGGPRASAILVSASWKRSVASTLVVSSSARAASRSPCTSRSSSSFRSIVAALRASACRSSSSSSAPTETRRSRWVSSSRTDDSSWRDASSSSRTAWSSSSLRGSRTRGRHRGLQGLQLLGGDGRCGLLEQHLIADARELLLDPRERFLAFRRAGLRLRGPFDCLGGLRAQLGDLPGFLQQPQLEVGRALLGGVQTSARLLQDAPVLAQRRLHRRDRAIALRAFLFERTRGLLERGASGAKLLQLGAQLPFAGSSSRASRAAASRASAWDVTAATRASGVSADLRLSRRRLGLPLGLACGGLCLDLGLSSLELRADRRLARLALGRRLVDLVARRLELIARLLQLTPGVVEARVGTRDLAARLFDLLAELCLARLRRRPAS